MKLKKELTKNWVLWCLIILLKFINRKRKNKKSDQIIDFYLNELSGFKINSSASFLNNKTFDTFIKDDIQKTQNIIEFMEKNKELSTQRSYTAFNGEDKTRNREIIVIILLAIVKNMKL